MESKLQGLPPLKRFRLMQQQQENEEVDAKMSSPLPAKKRKQSRDPAATPITDAKMSSPLPAKKRKQSRDPAASPITTEAVVTRTTTYSLPAKKRVWALQPNLLDLNLEYDPSLEKVKEAIQEEEKLPPFVTDTNQSAEPIKEESVDDDGIVCAICQSTDGDPIDPIVFCDGCNLMVHTTCYGNPLVKGVPDGDWFCHQCLSRTEKEKKPFACCLCPSTEGALKPTSDGRWAHVLCTVFVPEVFFRDPVGRDGIDCSKVPQRRWEDKCYVCGTISGCVIDCSDAKCGLAFHVPCGLKEELCIEFRQGSNKSAIVAGFCKDHTELWKKEQETGKFKIVAREEHKN